MAVDQPHGGEAEAQDAKLPEQAVEAEAEETKVSPEPATQDAQAAAGEPQKPRKPGNAYMLFGSSVREEVIKEAEAKNGVKPKMGEVAKLIGARWSALSEEEKNIWKDKVAADKERYEAEMKTYQEKMEAAGAKEETTPTKKKPAKRASGGSDASPPDAKKPRVAKEKEPQGVEIDKGVLQEAAKLGWESQLRNLALRPEVVSSGKSARDMLKSLRASNGLVNAAKRRLLGC